MNENANILIRREFDHMDGIITIYWDGTYTYEHSNLEDDRVEEHMWKIDENLNFYTQFNVNDEWKVFNESESTNPAELQFVRDIIRKWGERLIEKALVEDA